MDVGGDVDAVDADVRQPAVLVRNELDLGDQGDERVGIVGPDATAECQPGRGAVQQAGVAEAVA